MTTFSLRDIENIYKKYPSCHSLKQDIIQFKENKHKYYLLATKQQYKFLVKPYRLLFYALYEADKINAEGTISPHKVFQKIIEIGQISESQNNDLVNLQDGFYEELLIFSIILIIHLDIAKKKELINYLIQLSKNKDAKYRNNNIIAIYILTYLLCEDSSLNYDLRKNIYFNTYGTAAYRLQYLQWDYLINSSLFYKNEVERNYKALLTTNQFATANQPYYFFWYDSCAHEAHINQKPEWQQVLAFCETAFTLRKKTWAQNEINQTKLLDEIINSVSAGISLKKHLMKNGLHHAIHNNAVPLRMFSYGMHSLFYACANCINYSNNRVKLREHIFNLYNDNTEFLDCVFIADYITRKSNLIYTNSCDKGTPTDNMYLLSGAFRIICAAGTPPNEKFIRYHLDKEMSKDYVKWLHYEKSRYKCLLCYMLSFSDFFNNKNHKRILDKNYPDNNTNFLQYDYLNISLIRKYRTEPLKWRKNTEQTDMLIS